MGICNAIRRGMTMLEVVIALAIFSSLVGLVAQSVMSATRTSDAMRDRQDAMSTANQTVNDLSLELRTAVKSTMTMTTSAGSTSPYQVVTYAYRVPTDIDASGVEYTGYCDRKVIYDQYAGTVTEVFYNANDATVRPFTKLIATNVAPPPPSLKSPKNPDGTYVYPSGGFTIIPFPAANVAVTLALQAAALSVDTGKLESGNDDMRWESKQSTVYVRSALDAGSGVVIAQQWTGSGTTSGSSTSGTTTSGTSTGGTTSGSPSQPPTNPPVITSASSASGADSTAFSYQITATNSPTMFGCTGTLPTGLSLNASTGLISGTPTISPSQTSFSVTISATNGGGTGSASLLLTFTTSGGTNAPVVTGGSANATVGTFFTYSISATNMGNNRHPVGYSAVNLPPGLGVDASSGAITGTPTQSGTWSVGISAQNSSGTGTAVLTIVVASPPPPPAPVVTSATQNATMNSAFSYQVSATNTGTSAAPVSYAATGLPAGLSIGSTNGMVSGTPTAMGGPTTATITVTNAGGSGTGTLTITVGPPAAWRPVVTGASLTASTGRAFVYNIIASNMDSSMYSGTGGYACVGLPPGLSVNANSGVIAGTPTAAGTYTVTATATNSYLSGSNTITITVAVGSIPVPVVTSASISGQQNSAMSYTISATNMSAANSPVGYAASNLPAGLSITASTGVISGTPTVYGTFTISLSATNGGGTGTGTLTLTLAQYIDPNAPVVSGGSASGTQASSFSYAINATNMSSNKHPVGYTATGLPSGLSVNSSSGLISGTPTTSGTYTVTIGASNSSGAGSATLTITISPPAAPVVGSGGTQTGTVGTAFTYQISATNMGSNYGPIGYAATGLPAGLSVSASTGAISGTPTAAGTSTVTITAQNSGGTGSATLTISIAAAIPPAITFNYTQPSNHGNINGSKITAVPPSGYTMTTSQVTVNRSTTSIGYSIATNSVAGIDANFSGNRVNGSSVTITATATNSSTGATITATSNSLSF